MSIFLLWPFVPVHKSVARGQCDVRQIFGYLPSRRESPPFGRCRIILLDDRGRCVCVCVCVSGLLSAILDSAVGGQPNSGPFQDVETVQWHLFFCTDFLDVALCNFRKNDVSSVQFTLYNVGLVIERSRVRVLPTVLFSTAPGKPLTRTKQYYLVLVGGSDAPKLGG